MTGPAGFSAASNLQPSYDINKESPGTTGGRAAPPDALQCYHLVL